MNAIPDVSIGNLIATSSLSCAGQRPACRRPWCQPPGVVPPVRPLPAAGAHDRSSGAPVDRTLDETVDKPQKLSGPASGAKQQATDQIDGAGRALSTCGCGPVNPRARPSPLDEPPEQTPPPSPRERPSDACQRTTRSPPPHGGPLRLGSSSAFCQAEPGPSRASACGSGPYGTALTGRP